MVPEIRIDSQGEVLKSIEHSDSISELAISEETDDGFLRGPGRIARTGILSYRKPDGSIFRELVRSDDLFDEGSLDSFRQLPLCLGHPVEDGAPSRLSIRNASKFTVGSVGNPRQDGDWLLADILITDEAAKTAVKSGHNGLSCGYIADIVMSSGALVGTDGSEQRFDAIQTNRRGNHVALTDRPRAGSEAVLRVDSTVCFPIEEVETLTKKTILGVELDIEEAQAKTLEAAIKLDSDALEVALGSSKALRKDNDLLRGKIDILEAQRLDSRDEVDINAVISKRVGVAGKAADVLGEPLNDLLKVDSCDLIKRCLEKKHPKVTLEGRGDDVLEGMFDMLSADKNPAAEINAAVAKTDSAPAFDMVESKFGKMKDAWKRKVA